MSLLVPGVISVFAHMARLGPTIGYGKYLETRDELAAMRESRFPVGVKMFRRGCLSRVVPRSGPASHPRSTELSSARRSASDRGFRRVSTTRLQALRRSTRHEPGEPCAFAASGDEVDRRCGS